MRSTTEVREIVLAERKTMVPLTIKRAGGRETDIEVADSDESGHHSNLKAAGVASSRRSVLIIS